MKLFDHLGTGRVPRKRRQIMDNFDSREYPDNGPEYRDYEAPQPVDRQEPMSDELTEYDLMHDAPMGIVNRLKPVRQDYAFTLKLMFSRKPMRSFNLSLNRLSLVFMAIFNLLFGSLALGAVLNRIVGAHYTALTGAVLPEGGKVFLKLWGYGVLMNLVSFAVLFIALFLMAILLGSKRQPLTRFAQTIIMAKVPQTLLTVIAFLFSLVYINLGIAMLIAAKTVFYIYLYAGFQKSHPTKRTSPFWLFPIVACLEVLLTFEIFMGALQAL